MTKNVKLKIYNINDACRECLQNLSDPGKSYGKKM